MPATPASTKRVKGVQIFRPIVYGNVAIPLTKETKTANVAADHTHRWTVSVRGVQNEDISYFIKRVNFKLHETYPNHNRTIESPPFEVSETGWGEFGVQIKIQFVPEAGEKSVQFYHHLVLHPFGPDKEAAKEQNRPVLSYQYEEIVFNEPTETMYEILTSHKPPTLPSKRSGKSQFALDTEGEEVDKYVDALKQVQDLKEEVKEKLLEKEKTLAAMKAGSSKYATK